MTTRVRRKDGQERLVHVRAFASRDRDGNIVSVQGVAFDVTERVSLQEKLEVSERLASVGMLAAGIIHEIANPLASASMAIEMAARASDATAGPGSSELGELLSDARSALDAAAEILRDVRVFSRHSEDDSISTDVHRVIDSALRLTRHHLRGDITLVRTRSDVPPVRAGASRLAQVLTNLVANAAQAILADAPVRELHVRAYAEPGWVTVEVADTGTGIHPDLLQSIFHPYVTTKGPDTGTGLGLTMCRQIVESVGGQISVSSTLNEGSVFRVRLPTA